MPFYKGISVGYCLQNDLDDTIQILENILSGCKFLFEVGAEAIMKSIVKNDSNVTRHPSLKQKQVGFSYLDTIHRLNNCVQEYMSLSIHFLEKNMLHVSLLFCNRALECMLNALYLKQNNGLFSYNIVPDDMLQVVSKDSGIKMVDSLIFIQSLSYLCQERSLISKMQTTHLKNLIKKADDLLLQFSNQLAIPTEKYHSVFE